METTVFLSNRSQAVRLPKAVARPEDVKKGDVISLNPVSLNKAPFKNIKERLEKSKPPKFLEVDSDKLTITIKEDPEVEELDLNIDFPSIVEFYSK